MSDTDSESDSEAFRPTRRRRTIVKLEIRDSSSSSSSKSDTNSGSDDSGDDPEASPVLQSAKRRHKRLPDTSSESSASSFGKRSAKRRPTRPIMYEDEESCSSDSTWNPNAGGSSASMGSNPQPSTSAAARRNDAVAAAVAAAAASAAAASTAQASIAGNSRATTAAVASSSASSSDDDATDKCPICLHSFRDQPLGVPNACDHSYCMQCIEEWARNVQTCPIDRLAFTSIARYEGGRFVERVPVEARTTELVLNDDQDLTHCELCNATDREDCMLLCDGCNRGYHMDCLQPALTEIPASSWYCDYCFDSDASANDDEAAISELITELEQIGVPETRLRVRYSETVVAPRITRTRQSERIRATILSRIAPSRRHAPVGSRETALGMPLPGRRMSLS